jgi:hypothetical protein
MNSELVTNLLVHLWIGLAGLRRQHPYLVVRKRFHLAKNSYDISNTSLTGFFPQGVISTPYLPKLIFDEENVQMAPI